MVQQGDVNEHNLTQVDNMRLSVSIGIVATWLAYLAARKEFFIPLLNHQFETFLLLLLSMSATFSFLFILSYASTLKFNDKNKVWDLDMPSFARKTFYDLSIDVTGMAMEYFSTVLFLTWLNHSFGNQKLIFGFATITYIILGIICIKLAWFVFIKSLSYVYEDNRKNASDIVKELGRFALSSYILYCSWSIYQHFQTQPLHTILLLGIYIASIQACLWSRIYAKTQKTIYSVEAKIFNIFILKPIKLMISVIKKLFAS